MAWDTILEHASIACVFCNFSCIFLLQPIYILKGWPGANVSSNAHVDVDTCSMSVSCGRMLML